MSNTIILEGPLVDKSAPTGSSNIENKIDIGGILCQNCNPEHIEESDCIGITFRERIGFKC